MYVHIRAACLCTTTDLRTPSQALYYNVNRIEYRYSVGDIQSERPWVLPSAPFAHTLDTPALLGVVDNNAFLDLGDFKTRLPTAYTQYSAAAQGSRRNKIPPPSISQLKDGALVQTTRAWLPQDFSWDLSLKGSPSISVKMEDMDDDAVILGVPVRPALPYLLRDAFAHHFLLFLISARRARTVHRTSWTTRRMATSTSSTTRCRTVNLNASLPARRARPGRFPHRP